MRCPGCGTEPMGVIDLHRIKVNRCSNMSCRGFWFDEYELRGVLAGEERALGIFDMDLLADVERFKGRLSERMGPGGNPLVTITCPHTSVEVDVDPATGGVYLDKGELGALREQLHEYFRSMDILH